MQCLLEFDSADGYMKALEQAGPPLMADVPNFSNRNPGMFVTEDVARVQA